MRKILYLLPLLLVVLFNRIYSQQPIWPMVQIPIWVGNQIQYVIYIPLYSTQLVYQINLTQPTNLTFIQFTVPESILQQQLQYCKTYDPYVTNNVSPSQCEFGWPAVVAIADQNGNIFYYWTEYQLIPLSYDSITGLPQTFEFPVNLPDQGVDGTTLSPGTYYLYIYYPSPFFFSFESAYNFTYMPICPSNPSSATSSNFNGGYCYSSSSTPTSFGFSYWYPYGQTLYVSLCGYGPESIVRYLYVKFNPAYPVMIVTDSYGLVTVENPSTGQTATLSLNMGALYDLRQLEVSYGLDPNQWNEIVSVGNHVGAFYYCISGPVWGFYLFYVPE